MKKSENTNKKDVFVTLIFTESTTSLLNLNLPDLEGIINQENSKFCILPEKELRRLKQQLLIESNNAASTSSKKDDGANNNNLNLGSHIGLFSNSNCSSVSELLESVDDFNLDEEEAEEEKTTSRNNNCEEILTKSPVIQLPLVTVRSMAHSDKLKIEQNNLYVKLLDASSSDSHQSTDLICRICHGGESIDDLLTPCRCRGTIALVHLKCLERWLKESNHSSCELCQHRYRIVREPQYSMPWSILIFLRHPGVHLKEIILDLMAFSIYTPSAVASTYMLMLICEALVKNNIVTTGSLSSHIIAFSAVFGMAAIDFTYSSWLIMTLQKHIDAWRDWYNANSRIKVVLPKIKLKPRKKK